MKFDNSKPGRAFAQALAWMLEDEKNVALRDGGNRYTMRGGELIAEDCVGRTRTHESISNLMASAWSKTPILPVTIRGTAKEFMTSCRGPSECSVMLSALSLPGTHRDTMLEITVKEVK